VQIFVTIRGISICISKGESLTTELEKTISDLERQREAIDRAISALREITGTARTTAKRSSAASPKKRAKRRITPEGKARIAEAQRQRWAAKRAAEVASKSAAASTAKKTARGKKAAKKTARARAVAPAPTKAAAAIAG
jgi:hypothetical protein